VRVCMFLKHMLMRVGLCACAVDVCVCVCVRVHVCMCARACVDVGVDVCLYVCEYPSQKKIYIRWPDRIICDICSDQLMRQRAPCPLA